MRLNDKADVFLVGSDQMWRTKYWKEKVDKINNGDSLGFQCEKFLRENGDKIPAEKKSAIESALNELKAAKSAQNIAGIDQAMEKMAELARKRTTCLRRGVGAVIVKDGEVIINKKCRPLLLNDTIMQDLSDYQLDKYYAPDIVLPVLSSRGCYWRKCSFCDQDFGQFHNTKDVDKMQLETQQKEIEPQMGFDFFAVRTRLELATK